MKHIKLFENFEQKTENLKVDNDQNMKDVTEYMVKAVKNHKWDLKDLIHYFEEDNGFDYQVRTKIWDDMNAATMPKTYDNIHKLLVAIKEANKK